MEFTQPEDYNWKFPTRTSTMYLSTIQKVNRRPTTSCGKNSMSISDIDGAQSKFLIKRTFNKESFINRNDDIDGAQRKQTKIMQVEDRRFKNNDTGQNMYAKKFRTTRTTNPLQPHYQLSVVDYLPPQIPRFVKDSFNVDDIEGTKTKPTKVITNYVKQQIKQKVKPVIQGQNYMNVTDINLYRAKHKTTRTTNPLQPTYQVVGEDNVIVQIGYIQKSKPKNSEILNIPDFMNNTGDIEGTWPVKFFNKHLISHKQGQLPDYKQTNYVKDITGTQVASKKKGIVSTRSTNPLFPKYNYPGHSQAKDVSSMTFQRPKTAVQKFDRFIS